MELTARTAAGARLLALAGALAGDLATRAARHDHAGHDRAATHPPAGIDALRDAGYLAAPIPDAHGGLGVASVHDLVVASSRLARGDASVAIATNTHLAAVLTMVRGRRIALTAGHARRAAGLASALEAVARDRVVLTAAASEPGAEHLAAGLLHAAVALGVAEAAHRHALEAVARRGGAADARTRSLVAENAIDLTACRGALARGATLVDDHEAAHPASHGSDEQRTALHGEVQAVKAFVTDAAARLVDRALALARDEGSRARNPIARAYRDVRADGLLHPLASLRAYELVGELALGLTPAAH
jgi:alkylation response protein AidB-like acyl-CoA dehydrogenase